MNAEGENDEADHEDASITVGDLRRSLALSSDLLDEEIMRGCWE